MATAVLPTNAFPPGTAAAAYPASNWRVVGEPPRGAPVGSLVASATVDSGGTLTFTGLADDTGYYAAAQIAGVWTYWGFETEPWQPVESGQALLAARTRGFVVSVKDPPYNAVGDGVADDTAALRAAHAACQAAGGGTIFYPKGTYKVIPNRRMFTGKAQARYAALGLASDCHMLGAPGARILAPVGSSGLPHADTRWQEGTVAATDSFVADGLCNADRWSIRNLIFDEGASTGLEAYSMQIMCGHSDYWTVADCTFQNFQGDAIVQIADNGVFAKGWRIERNVFKNGGGNPIVYMNASDFWITDNFIEGPVFSGSAAEAIITEYSTTCTHKRGTISRNIVLNWGDINVGYGTDWNVSDNTITVPTGSSGSALRFVGGDRIVCADNILDCALANTSALRFSNYTIRKMAITGNIIKGGAGGTNPFAIHAAPVTGSNEDWVVTGNIIQPLDPTGPAVYIASDGLIFSDNIVKGAGAGTVVVNNSTGRELTMVTGNVIDGYVNTANTADAVISNNRIESPIYVAILSGAGTVITGNRLKVATASAVAGVIDLPGSGSVVTGNRCETTVTNSYWLFEKTGATGNVIADNVVVVGAGVAKLNIAASSTSTVRNTIGYVMEKRGVASVANGATIAHGLAAAPTTYGLTPTVAGRQVAITAVSATTLTVSLTDSDGVAVAVAENVQWRAEI